MTYCKPCHNKITRASVDANGGNRNYQLRRRYGITAEHADAMFAEQGGLCAVCREAPAEHVDHDHALGICLGPTDTGRPADEPEPGTTEAA